MSAEKWNQRFREPFAVYGDQPNEFLVSQVARVRAGGLVACLGEGEGRNACFLAQLGYRVVAVDYSQVGLEKTTALARQRGVTVKTVCADLTSWHLPVDSFDAIVSIFVHLLPESRKRLHHQAVAGLRMGGVFIGEFFSSDQLKFNSGGPKSAQLLYHLGELQKDFESLRVDLAEQRQVVLNEGSYHQGPASVIRIVAIRHI